MIEEITHGLGDIRGAIEDRTWRNLDDIELHGRVFPAGQLGLPEQEWPEWFNPNSTIVPIAAGGDSDTRDFQVQQGTIVRDWGLNGDLVDGQPAGTPPIGWSEVGVEILAAYFSFHRGRRWGIVIRSYGVEKIGSLLQSKGLSRPDAFIHAYNFLLRHELGHYQVDLMAANAELISRKPIYLLGKQRQRLTQPRYGVAEEGLNNALARSTLPVGFKTALDDWLRLSPTGYRDFQDHSRGSRAQSWARVMSELVDAPIPWATTIPLTATTESQVPVYLLVDGAGSPSSVASSFMGPISNIVETKKFLKDLRKSGNEQRLRKGWNQRKHALLQGRLAGGTHLEEIGESIYSVRIGSAARVALKHDTSGWAAIMLDQNHDQFYRRIQTL